MASSRKKHIVSTTHDTHTDTSISFNTHITCRKTHFNHLPASVALLLLPHCCRDSCKPKQFDKKACLFVAETRYNSALTASSGSCRSFCLNLVFGCGDSHTFYSRHPEWTLHNPSEGYSPAHGDIRHPRPSERIRYICRSHNVQINLLWTNRSHRHRSKVFLEFHPCTVCSWYSFRNTRIVDCCRSHNGLGLKAPIMEALYQDLYIY